MKATILILDSYEGFRESALLACAELNYTPLMIPAFKADIDLVNRIREIYPGDTYPDVIITRGAIATYLADFFPNAVISLADPDDMDFLYALKKARQYGANIGIIIRDAYEFEKKALLYQSILDISRLTPYRYDKAEDVVMVLRQAVNDGIDVTVGGGTLAYSASAKIGIPNIFVPTSVLSIKDAIKRALLHVKYKNEERAKNQYFGIAMNYVESGLLIVEGDTIRFANAAMREILGIDPAHLANSSYTQIFHDAKSIPGDVPSEKILSVKSKNYLVKEDERLGPGSARVVIFQDTDVLRRREHTVRNILYNKGYHTNYRFSDIVAESAAMKTVIDQARVYARTDAPILITGASGTGKELLSHSIHHESERSVYPFVPINCAAIPRELLESEFFGYEEGAFTGARKGGKIGLFEIAHKGTVYLDEINSLPIDLQGKLLRVIEEKEFRRVGSEKLIKSDVRIISSTNETLLDLIHEKQFRNDLYHRISTLTIKVASLNERRDDIIPLSNIFLQHYGKKYNILIIEFTKEEQNILLSYNYEGSVRELENIIHRFVIQYPFHSRQMLLPLCLNKRKEKSGRDKIDNPSIILSMGSLANMEMEIINIYLQIYNNNKNTVADQLRISRSTLWRKICEAKKQRIP